MASNVYNFSYEAYQSVIFSGSVSHSLLKLKHLEYLDLSNNDFEGKPVPEFLGSVENLKYLNLCDAGFGGKIPGQLGNLSNLQYLDLHGTYIGGRIPDQLGNLSNLQYLDLQGTHLYTENSQWISCLSSLKYLCLNFVGLAKASNWLKDFSSLPSLEELHLSGCHFSHEESSSLHLNFTSLSTLDLSGNNLHESSLSWIFQVQSLTSLNLAMNFFQGQLPLGLQNLTSLRKLDLSVNAFHSSVPDWLYRFNHLEVLNLGYDQFLEGDISSGFGNMTSLITLDLSSTKLQGWIPQSFKSLCNLRKLQLSSTELKQEVNEVLNILVGCVSNGLEYLYLDNCKLSGHLTHHLGMFKSLVHLNLGQNLISGPTPQSLGQLTTLELLDLSNNEFDGTLPLNFGGLDKLKYIDISNNFLVGEVFEVHLVNLTLLRRWFASGNQLQLRVSSEWIPPFRQITDLDLGSWLIGPQFPSWLSLLESLVELDLSNCGISSTIPPWFWESRAHFTYLNLSNNEIEGMLPNKPNISLYSVQFLDFGANFFEGSLPFFSSTTIYLDLSNNLLSGLLSCFLCSELNSTNSLAFLKLQGNMFQGEIPDCWMNWGELALITLSNNNLRGGIPNSIGNLGNLEFLHLANNELAGEIPLSLQNCTNLLSLDIGENQLVGSIPTWIGERFSGMVFFSLRGNKFQGPIRAELCHLSFLHILDLANNHFSGPIPNCINNFRAMTVGNASGYVIIRLSGSHYTIENFRLVMKGKEVEYNSILQLVRIIDLSCNNLSGEIPEGITRLKGLQSLNLSHNGLIGRIPIDIGDMKSLESIDFSRNQLVGEVPQSMASLNFLSYLDLSHNNLTGRIPLGTQLQSFNSSSFDGNEGLCGAPLTKNCSEGHTLQARGSSNVHIDWFYVSMALGYVVGLWGVLGPLVFNRRWRDEFFQLVDYLGNKVYWSFH